MLGRQALVPKVTAQEEVGPFSRTNSLALGI